MSATPSIRMEIDGPGDIAEEVADGRNHLVTQRLAFRGPVKDHLGHEGVGTVVVHAAGDHFSAGLDLASLDDLDAFGGMPHSRSWHGASARVPELIGAHRMADMMLTGRVLSSDEGQSLGISNYLVDDGDGLDKAMELAATVAENTPVTNFAIINALPRIANAHPTDGYLMESMVSAIAQH